MTDSGLGSMAVADSTVSTLVIGEALIDAVTTPAGEVSEHVGGSPANVAFGLGALGHQVDLATWIGQDARGQQIADLCRSRGVALTPGSDGARSTSVAHATLDADGAASYDFDLEWKLPDLARPAAYGHVHTGSIAAVLEPGGRTVRAALKELRERATVSYDPNARPTLMGSPSQARAVVSEVMALADVVKLSDEDVAWLFPDLGVDALLDGALNGVIDGPALLVITRGAGGASVALPGRMAPIGVPAAPTHPADTVGAGDSFMAGLISGLLDAGLLGGARARELLRDTPTDEITAPVLKAIDRAARTAAVTVARHGAYAPTRNEI